MDPSGAGGARCQWHGRESRGHRAKIRHNIGGRRKAYTLPFLAPAATKLVASIKASNDQVQGVHSGQHDARRRPPGHPVGGVATGRVRPVGWTPPMMDTLGVHGRSSIEAVGENMRSTGADRPSCRANLASALWPPRIRHRVGSVSTIGRGCQFAIVAPPRE